MSGGIGAGVVVLLVLGVVAAGGVAALVLFIVGLVRGRAGMWAAGLVLGVLCLLALPLLGAAMWFAVGTRPAAPPPPVMSGPAPTTGPAADKEPAAHGAAQPADEDEGG